MTEGSNQAANERSTQRSTHRAEAEADPTVTPAVELTAAPADPRSRTTTLLASVAAIALAAAGLAVLASGDDDGPVPLTLQSRGTNTLSGEDAAAGAPADARTDLLPFPTTTFEYRLAGALADLGSTAPVYRLVAPDGGNRVLDAAEVARMADALGIAAAPVELDYGGWEASDGERTLSVSGDASGWFVSVANGPGLTRDGVIVDGSGGAGADGSTGTGTDTATDSVEPDTATDSVEPDTATDSVEPDTAPTPDTTAPDTDPGLEPEPVPVPEPTPVPIPEPVDLPDPAEAQRIAEDLLAALGVLDGADWQFTVNDGTTMGIAVSCVEGTVCDDTVEPPVLTSRSVVAQRMVDGRAVIGLEWYVEVGDLGLVQYAGGMLADLERVDDYPLQSTTDVYDALVRGDFGGGPVPLGAPEAMSSVDPGVAIDCPPDTRCAAPDIACVDDCPEPQVVTITVTGVTLASQLWYATDGAGNPVQYLVPSYRFVGSFDDGTEWSSVMLAIDDAYVTGAEPTPTPMPDDDVPGSDVPVAPPQEDPATK